MTVNEKESCKIVICGKPAEKWNYFPAFIITKYGVEKKFKLYAAKRICITQIGK